MMTTTMPSSHWDDLSIRTVIWILPSDALFSVQMYFSCISNVFLIPSNRISIEWDLSSLSLPPLPMITLSKKIQYVVFPSKWLTSLSKYNMLALDEQYCFHRILLRGSDFPAAPSHLCCSRLWCLWEDGEWWWVCCLYLFVSVFVCGSVLFCALFHSKLWSHTEAM